MARKKEYSGMAADANSTTSSGGKRTSKNDMSNDAQCEMDLDRLNPISKRKEVVYPGTSVRNVYDVADLRAQLGSFGLTVRDIPGDGNCLFRALGDQLDGHTGNHLKHRLDTVRYMINHRGHFEPFIDVPFDRYVNDLSRPGTYAGQDALVAFARLHEVNIIIHQLNRPLWKIQGSEDSNAPELHLSYHNGEHYSSVRRFGDIANTPAGIRIMAPTTVPCCASHSVYTSTKPLTSHANSANLQQSAANLHKHNTNASNEGAVNTYFYEKDEFTTLVHEVMNRTGCCDALATEALIENSGDLDQAVDYLLSLALFVTPDGDSNLSKSMNRSDMEKTEHRILKGRNNDVSRHRTLPACPTRADFELTASEQQEKRGRKQGGNMSEEQLNKQGDLRFLTL
ncbi:UBA/TS-N domain containing protein [Brugia malayi]|uniref:Bm8317 n=4 Tax=Brugia TaxID=6278 RepID=A0A0K0JVG5_BRUMA|nr:UBA/TS-N domain containing protein [Brugia malayi]CDQ05871.2 Bm8317 [Brugia malayi]VIO93242.1 UBA/TS-N domain containing protein [Brugia malayi]